MPSRTTPPFRADHVGSLLRPPRLIEARAAHPAGGLTEAELRAVEDDAVAEAVAMQESVGLQSATDGEFRRSSWHMDFIYQLGGVSRIDENITVTFKNAEGSTDFTPSGLRVDGRGRLEHTIFGADFEALTSMVGSACPKLTIPSPSMVHYRGGRAAVDPDVYPEMDAFWADLCSAYSAEIRRLADLGCSYLQLDETSLAYLNDPTQRAQLTERGDDADTQHLEYIHRLNAALAGRPDGMTVTTHMCRGNFRSSWVAEGGYDFVAEALFTECRLTSSACPRNAASRPRWTATLCRRPSRRRSSGSWWRSPRTSGRDAHATMRCVATSVR